MNWDNWREADINGYVSGEPCEHAGSHEKYDVEVGDCGYGPIWEQGIRCPVCKRKWADPEVEARRHREWLDDQARHWNAVVGTDQEQIQSLSGNWGDSEAALRDQYEHLLDSWAGVYHPPYPESTTPEDLVEHHRWTNDCMMEGRERILWPPVERSFWVFHADCGPCDVTVEQGGMERRYTDEWNLLMNWPGISHPMHPAAREVWDRLKVPFSEAVRRIADPRPRYRGDPSAPRAA